LQIRQPAVCGNHRAVLKREQFFHAILQGLSVGILQEKIQIIVRLEYDQFFKTIWIGVNAKKLTIRRYEIMLVCKKCCPLHQRAEYSRLTDTEDRGNLIAI